MANDCYNKFYISSDNKETIKNITIKLDKLIDVTLEGSIDYIDDFALEGWFCSKWDFPEDIFNNFFTEFDDETIYMRCLSEEYGCGIVSMNVYNDSSWWEPQYFDF